MNKTKGVKKTPVSRASRLWAALWLLAAALGWSGLIIMSRQTSHWAIAWTGRGFAWMIPVTYVAIWGWAIASARDGRSTLIRSLATTVVLASILFILELPAALRLVHWPLLFEKAAGDGTNFLWAYRVDPDLGFGRRPHDRWSGRPPSDIEHGYSMPPSLHEPITFTYDESGYRNESPPDVAHVVLLGDSYVEGSYVSDEQTVARQLEKLLDRPVINLGVAGYGPMQELIVLRRDAVKYRPRVAVVFFFEGNDLYDDEAFENAQLAAAPSVDETLSDARGFARNDSWRRRSFSRAVLLRLRRWANPVVASQAPYFGFLQVPGQNRDKVYFADYAAVPWSDWVEERWNRAETTLERAVVFGRENGIQVLLVFVPIKFRVYRSLLEVPAGNPARSWTVWPIRDRFAEFCDSNDVICIDLTDPFVQAASRGAMPYSAVDSHWSREGHALVAELLATELRDVRLGTYEPSARAQH